MLTKFKTSIQLMKIEIEIEIESNSATQIPVGCLRSAALANV